MTSRAKTPSPPNWSAPASSPMPSPATPAASSPSSAGSSKRTAPRTPATLASPSIRTPDGRLRTCSANPTLMTVVKVHTAKCTECDKRNKATMLRCPGCTFQICHPCRERREKNGRDLAHGGMMSPGGMGSGMGGLGSGTVVRRRVTGMPPVKKLEATEAVVVDELASIVIDEAKYKGKAVKKRPAAKGKAKVVMLDDGSSDEEFMLDPTSPTSNRNKRKRTQMNITDSPTATSARPSRTAPIPAHAPAYVAPSSPSSGSEVPAPTPTALRAPANLNSGIVKKAYSMETQHIKPTGRVHELLEQQGVRYEEHFLSRHVPVMTNRVISIPDVVKRMADPKPRLSAKQKVDERNRAMLAKRDEEIKTRTVRGVAESEALKYRSQHLSGDENEELSNAIKESARKWATRTHAKLPRTSQTDVARNLDMRLDHIDAAYKAQLIKMIAECASRKLKEFEQDREDGMPVPQ